MLFNKTYDVYVLPFFLRS